MQKDISSSEALYGFVAWLTTRDEVIKIGGHNDCAPVTELLIEWCTANGLEPPRDNVYPNNLAFPSH